jgi:hypothetical protein
MKKLLITTAIFEALTGILLMTVPLLVASMLLGEESLGAVALTITRITGAALISLAMVCFFSLQSDNARNVVKAMLFYNIAVTLVLIYSKLGLDLKGNGLVPVIGAHLILAVWGIVIIQSRSTQPKA